jgi:hypothetical protein
MPRLTAEFWVQAYLTRLRLAQIPAFVVKHGDDGAGAVLVKLNTLDGKARAFSRNFGADGARVWSLLCDDAEPVVDEAIERQRRYDPDLWVIEVEDRLGRTLLEEPGLAE